MHCVRATYRVHTVIVHDMPRRTRDRVCDWWVRRTDAAPTRAALVLRAHRGSAPAATRRVLVSCFELYFYGVQSYGVQLQPTGRAPPSGAGRPPPSTDDMRILDAKRHLGCVFHLRTPGVSTMIGFSKKI